MGIPSKEMSSMKPENRVKIRDNIINSIIEAIGVRKMNVKGNKIMKPWLMYEVKILIREEREVYLEYRNAMQECKKYKIKNRVNQRIKDLKEYWKKFISDIKHDLLRWSWRSRKENIYGKYLCNRKKLINE